MFMRQAGALDTMEAYIVYLQNYARRARDIEDDDRVIAEKVLSDLWAKFITRLDNLFKLITALLNDLINDRSNVVLAPAYVPLLEMLNRRVDIITALKQRSAPIMDAEIRQLQEVQDEYKRLRRTLGNINESLRIYLSKSVRDGRIDKNYPHSGP